MTRRATPRRAGTGGVSHGFGLGLTPCDRRPADPPPEVRRGQQQQRYRSHERGALRDREKVRLRPTRSGPACAYPGISVVHRCNPSSVPAAPSTAPCTHELALIRNRAEPPSRSTAGTTSSSPSIRTTPSAPPPVRSGYHSRSHTHEGPAYRVEASGPAPSRLREKVNPGAEAPLPKGRPRPCQSLPPVNGHRRRDTLGTPRGGSGATGAGRSGSVIFSMTIDMHRAGLLLPCDPSCCMWLWCPREPWALTHDTAKGRHF